MALRQSASGAEGRGAEEPDGRRLDGRRLVPLRRVPSAELRLLRRPDQRRAARATIIARQGYDDYDNFLRAGSAGDFAQRRRPRPAPVLAQDHRASGLRQLLARAGARQASWPRSRSTVPTMWIQGLWDQEDMWGAIHSYLAVEPKDTRQRQELSRDGSVAPQPASTTTASTLGPLKWDGDTALRVPARRAEAVLRSVSEGRRAEGRHAAGVHLQHRREPLGPLPVVAARVRDGLRDGVEAALPDRRRSGCRFSRAAPRRDQPPASTSTSPIRPSRCRIIPRPVRFADGDAWRRWLLTRSALRRRSSRRPDLRDAGADRAGAHQRRAGREPGGVHQRHRQRLGREADRRLSRRSPEPARDGRLPARRSRWTSSAAAIARASRRRRRSRRTRRCRITFALPTANHVFLPGHRIMVQVQSTLVPALRPQPADLRAEHLLCEASRLSEGHDSDLSRGRDRRVS